MSNINEVKIDHNISNNFSSTGKINEVVSVRNRNLLNFEITGVGSGNVVEVRAKILDGTEVVLKTVTGPDSNVVVDVAKYDIVEFNCTTFESSGTPNLNASFYLFIGTSLAVEESLALISQSSSPVVSSLNSTNTPLDDTDVFTGQWEKRTTQGLLMAYASDQSFTWVAQFAESLSAAIAGDIDSSLPYTYTAGAINVPRPLVIAREYFRIVITNNSGSDMTFLRAQTSLGPYSLLASKLNASLSNDADAEVVRAVVTGQQPDGDYVNAPADGIATDVSGISVETTSALLAGANYESGWCDTDGFKSIELSIKADQVSDDEGIIIEYTNDANAATPVAELTKTFSFNEDSVALGDLTILIPPRLDGFRIRYVNGATNQSNFLLAATLRNGPVQSVELPISSPVNKNTNALITRTVTVGATPDAEFENSVQSGKFQAGSTSTPLGAGGEFIGAFLDASRYVMLQIAIISDQYYDDTAYTDTQGNTGGILLELSADGSTVAQSFALRVSDVGVAPNYFLYFTPGRQFVRFKYTNGETAQNLFELSLFAYTNAIGAPVGSVLSGMSNFSLAQQTKSAIFVENDDGSNLRMLTYSNAGQEINNSTRTLNTKTLIVAPDSAGDYDIIHRIEDALLTALKKIDTDIARRPSTRVVTGQVNANSTTPIQIPRPSSSVISQIRGLEITNQSNGAIIYFGSNNTVTKFTGDAVLKESYKKLNVGDNSQDTVTASEIWLISDGAVATTQTDDLDADTVDSNTGVTDPTNAFASDGSYAVLDDIADTFTISGFDAGGALLLANIQSVKIKLEARKGSSATNEVSSFVDVVGQDAGNVTSITSPAVTLNTDHFYIVSVSRRDEFANITQINDTMGFDSWILIGDTGTDSAESRTSVYYAVGNPTSGGTVTASFSQSADHCVIAVSRFEDIDMDTPIDAVTTFGANNSTGVYSNNVSDGTDDGQFVLCMGFEQGSHNAALNPAGATERFQDGSTNGNDQIHNVITANLAANGAVAFNGTVNGAADISYVAFTLKPAAGENPVVAISNSQGATTLSATLSSTSNIEFEQDITADAAWTDTIIDAMTLTTSVSSIGEPNIEIDRLWVEVISSDTIVAVPYSWIGDPA